MPDEEMIGNSGICYTSVGLGKIAYDYNKKSNSYTITTQGGTVIECRSQSKKNKASIYLISDGNKELLAIENVAYAKIVASKKVHTTLNLSGCNGCYADMSQNNSSDYITSYNSDTFTSHNNTVKIDSADKLYFESDNQKDEINISSSGKYNENIVKKEANSFLHKIFGYSKVD